MTVVLYVSKHESDLGPSKNFTSEGKRRESEMGERRRVGEKLDDLGFERLAPRLRQRSFH
jgi:hypothetical protein